MRPVQLFATIASFSAIATAWPWPDSFENKALHGIEAMLYRRQNSNSNSQTSNSATATGKTTSATSTGKTSATATGKTSATGKNSATTGSNSGSSHAAASKTAAGSGSAATGDSGNSTTTAPGSSHTDFDPRDGPASVVMVTPGVFSPSQYYKIGDWVTFAWNYTSIQGTPTAIDVVASCSAAQATFTIASNSTFDPAGGTILWDTNGYEATATQQLLTNTYTLIIVDADLGLQDTTAVPGYLSPVQALKFGMYTPQPYTPFSEFSCPTCSGAMSSTEKQTLGFLFGMASITVLSFTWFASGRFGVL